jgi:hypothetical protein
MTRTSITTATDTVLLRVVMANVEGEFFTSVYCLSPFYSQRCGQSEWSFPFIPFHANRSFPHLTRRLTVLLTILAISRMPLVDPSAHNHLWLGSVSSVTVMVGWVRLGLIRLDRLRLVTLVRRYIIFSHMGAPLEYCHLDGWDVSPIFVQLRGDSHSPPATICPFHARIAAGHPPV